MSPCPLLSKCNAVSPAARAPTTSLASESPTMRVELGSTFKRRQASRKASRCGFGLVISTVGKSSIPGRSSPPARSLLSCISRAPFVSTPTVRPKSRTYFSTSCAPSTAHQCFSYAARYVPYSASASCSVISGRPRNSRQRSTRWPWWLTSPRSYAANHFLSISAKRS